ncbi:MFS transporter [Sporomusa sp. KB1]|uniref:MFS transporter n=1 Tax=Sporomusa sp. KB1 TaxID=943346 RepID=UPI0011ABB80B|nr:MFS transporter [Sporomusa sp. KB1]TWH52085.1 putative MFS family arabinose efflux permease [Sporomusa sp. KB1]
MGKKLNNFWLRAACLSVAPFMFTMSFYNPALGAIAKAFPDTPTVIIQNVSTITSLATALIALIYGWLARRMSSRNIALLGIAISSIGSLIPAFGGDIMVILVCRFITGLGTGLMFPLATNVIIEFFTGRDKDGMMGIKGTVGNIGSMTFAAIGGYLASIYWRTAFWGYLIMIIPFLIILFKLPKSEIQQEEHIAKAKLNIEAYGLIIWNLFFNVFYLAVQLNTAIVISKMKLGTPSDAGLVISTFTLFGALAGLTYLPVNKLFKRFTLPFTLVLFSIAFGIFYNATSLSMFYLAAVLDGFAFGTYNTAFVLTLTGIVKKDAVPSALGLYIAGMKMGQFLSPFLLTFLVAVFGLQGPKSQFLVSGSVFVCATIVAVLIMFFYKSKHSDTKPKPAI